MMTLGEKVSQEEADEMVKAGDKNGNGTINYAEFAEMIVS